MTEVVPGASSVDARTVLPSRGIRMATWYVVATRGEVTEVTGKPPSAMDPERRRFWLERSMAMDVIPSPGIKVEKAMASPAAESLVRKPDAVPMMAGTTAATVG
jgi:hypothetical protein